MGIASCSRRRDPCEAAYFNEFACEEAVRSGGYYWGGTWYPMVYRYPYPYYFDSYHTYVSRGGRVYGTPTGSYSRPANASGSSSSSSGTVRGGFGSTGAGHASGE